MKVIFRADDVGYTKVHNLGTWKSVEEGVVTTCDLMLDTPGTEDACQYLRAHPWLSVGWHTHFWGRPVLDAEEVPSLVDSRGRFAWRHDKEALKRVDAGEALAECRAELERCWKLLGRVPDTASAGLAGPGADAGALGAAIRQACSEYDIACDVVGGVGYDHKERYVAEPWQRFRIKEWIDFSKKHGKSLKVEDFGSYDPLGAIMEMPMDEGCVWMRSQHPGFLDDYVLGESSCTIPRVKDVEALCSPTLKRWIRENHIELASMRDVLQGTHEYQDHLERIGSPLWAGSF